MKKPPVLLALSGAAALAGALLFPSPSSGQAAADPDPALAQLLTEVSAQQFVVAENHAKIDEKLVAIAEELRLARIFVSRGGGKAK